ncbi:MAG: NAD(P)-dependent oxidoreductase [Candidatus Saccharicenans sp.]|jgi:nucleoside-diphosphate-sugar epimerase|nr:NAD(P)-dependent oxidoreductase [Candidatus Saccharicenans sp.]MDH7575635.1 NAD(P)-dependent oxidoreductase [Candidatus Saccharicenans sp.]
MEISNKNREFIIGSDDLILVTGAAGFIGRYLVGELIKKGYSNIRCLARETSDLSGLKSIIHREKGQDKCTIALGNLLRADDCYEITEGVKVIYHLAAGTGTKSFSEAYLNSVVTTKNLIEASLRHGCLKRLVNVSSFAVYTNLNKKTEKILDETCPVEASPESRAEAYCYGKVKQDELVINYGREKGLPYVIVRPGTVYGPGKCFIPGRVGIDSFGPFLHLGGSNPLPLSYVANCAEAIMLCGLVPELEGQIFNIVDDNLPSSRKFLRLYKKYVKNIRSIYIPKFMSLLFCIFWEKFSRWSSGQIPPVYTYREWAAYWKKTYYSNMKLKQLTGWKPRVSTEEGLKTFFEYCRNLKKN